MALMQQSLVNALENSKQIEIIFLEPGAIMVLGQFLFLIFMLISLVTLKRYLKKFHIGKINLKIVVKKSMNVGPILMVINRRIHMVTFIQLLYLSMFSFSN